MTVLIQSWEGSQQGQLTPADPRDVPDPVVFCSAVKTGEEAGRGEHLEFVFPSHHYT